MSFIGIDHVQIAAPAGCEPAARQFFGELLGLTEIEKPEPLRRRGGLWFTVGAQQLHIGVEDVFAPARKAHPGLRVESERLEEIAGRLTGAGRTVLWDHAITGTRRFFCEDPWGNRIELLAFE